MKYAVIEIKGGQHLVKEGEEILVDRVGEKKVEPRVLLLVDGGRVKVGKPVVKGASVKAKLLGDEKGEKLHVQTYKAKSRYRRKLGFRPEYTRLKIEKITG